MTKASARHLLVSDEQTCLDLKNKFRTAQTLVNWPKKTPAVLPVSRVALSVSSAPARWSRNLIPLCSMKPLAKFMAP